MQKFELARFRTRLFAVITEQLFTELFSGALTLGVLALINSSDLMFNLYAAMFGYYFNVVLLDFINHVFISRITNGKSFGKALFNIRVVKVDNSKIRFLDLAIRWVVFNVFSLGLGWVGVLVNFLVMRTRELKQGFHDNAVETIVIKSKTSIKKKLVLIIGLIVAAIISFIIIIISSLSLMVTIGTAFEERLTDDLETIAEEKEVYKSLSGSEGAIAYIPEDKSFGAGYIEYQQALRSIEIEDYDSAMVEIDKAFEKNPNEGLIQVYRCFIHTQFINADAAYKICEDIYKKSPENPAVISYLINNAYYTDRYDQVNKLSEDLYHMQFDSTFDNETLSYYYGNAGVFLALSEVHPELGKKMLSEAITLTSYEEDKEYYQGYLDSYKSNI